MSNIDSIAQGLSSPGRSAITYRDTDFHAERPLTLHTYRPAGYTPDRPVVIVQHGVLRNGNEYRDFWIPAADKHQILIVAPTFSDAAWPRPESYNNGLAFDDAGQPQPLDAWGYALIARIVADLRAAGITTEEQAYLYGHSAGGQFVHRLLSTQPHTAFKAATAGNPGWYTLPTFEHDFPEGLGGIGLDPEQLVQLLAYPLAILAGDQDIVTEDPNLPSEPAAKRQGAHRFARAHHYYARGQQEAARLGVPCNWTLHEVPGIGHDGRSMSAVCASLWFEGKMPDAQTLAALASQQEA